MQTTRPQQCVSSHSIADYDSFVSFGSLSAPTPLLSFPLYFLRRTSESFRFVWLTFMCAYIAMAVSLEARTPFLDMKVLEYALNLPAAAKIHTVCSLFLRSLFPSQSLPKIFPVSKIEISLTQKLIPRQLGKYCMGGNINEFLSQVCDFYSIFFLFARIVDGRRPSHWKTYFKGSFRWIPSKWGALEGKMSVRSGKWSSIHHWKEYWSVPFLIAY